MCVSPPERCTVGAYSVILECVLKNHGLLSWKLRVVCDKVWHVCRVFGASLDTPTSAAKAS